jgi:hypothetical protein
MQATKLHPKAGHEYYQSPNIWHCVAELVNDELARILRHSVMAQLNVILYTNLLEGAKENDKNTQPKFK